MTNIKVHNALAIDITVDDFEWLGISSNFLVISRDFAHLEANNG